MATHVRLYFPPIPTHTLIHLVSFSFGYERYQDFGRSTFPRGCPEIYSCHHARRFGLAQSWIH